MQLIQRKTLVYQAGTSDKVYEVDLCQVAAERYVVNFRYGRQGGTLKEGSQTPVAVVLTAAQLAFDKLVNAKVAKGYREAGAVEPSAPPPVSTPTLVFTPNTIGRDQHILDRLTAAIGNPQQSNAPKQWPLDRVIWRSGELQLTAAAPLLMQLWEETSLHDTNSLRKYCIAWALGNCGDSQAVPLLEHTYRDSRTADHVRRVCLEAIFKLSESRKTALQRELVTQLPPEIRSAIEQDAPATVLLERVKTYLNSATPEQFALLCTLYQIEHSAARAVVLAILQNAPLQPNHFQPIRHIFKIAEYRLDAEILGILTYRFDSDTAFYQSSHNYLHFPKEPGRRKHTLRVKTYERNAQTGKYRKIRTPEFVQEISSTDARIAYGTATRNYLRRRIWRSLKALGETDRSEYIDIATEILLQYSDDHAGSVKESVRYEFDRRTWQRREQSRSSWDIYAQYLTFNHILYTNSPRYELKSRTHAWRCKPGIKPGTAPPTTREEAFPHLWTRDPAALLHLLRVSTCQPVHEFAATALADCSQFCQGLDLDTLLLLLAQPYEVTAQLGFEVARSRYQPNNPQTDLVLAMANCAYAPARAAAHQWLSAQIDHFLADDTLITRLVISPQTDTQFFMRELLRTRIITTAQAQVLSGRIIAGLLALTTDHLAQAEIATQTLIVCFQVQLRSVGLAIILDFLRHPLAILQTTGAQLLLEQQTPAIDLPSGLIDALIESPIDAVRAIGIQLFGQLPDELLRDRLDLILSFTTHPIPAMRQAIIPCLQRLAVDPHFLAQLIDRLLPLFLNPEASEGLHRFLSQLLQIDLTHWHSATNQATAWMLVSAHATAAQELGGKLFQTNAERWATNLSTERIALLTHHEVLMVRAAGWQMLSQILPRLRQSSEDLLTATLVMASSWEDTRHYGFTLFSELLQPAELTPAVVISICDSNREDVRRFGRDLVGQCFQSKDGLEYLLKFSEHPTVDMQLFASQYLEGYAANNPEKLAELIPYFGRVLAQVNRAKVAKERIFNFLNAEAIKSAAAAELVVEVLARQSASLAINERARSLETLLKIHQLYPELTVPITIKEIAVRS